MSLIEEDANAHVALEIGDNECLCETVAEEGGEFFFLSTIRSIGEEVG